MGPRNAVLGAGGACEFRNWDLRWSSLWGHETREGCAKMGAVTHANAATGTLGGAPYEATKRVRGVPKLVRPRMQPQPQGHSAEIPMGPRRA